MKNDAKWITSPMYPGKASYSYRKAFCIEKPVKHATFCVSSMGIYVTYMNGERVGKNVLAPGWTSYDERVQYQTYDVTGLLKEKNKIEINVGPGWAFSRIDCSEEYGQPSLIAWMEIAYTDNTTEYLHTDTDWEVYTSETLFSDLYDGEIVDKTAPVIRIGAATLTDVHTKLVPQVGEWICEQERLAPIKLIHTPIGEMVLDFGQNMTGYVEVSVKGERGHRIVLHFAEVLDKDGNFYNENYGTAKNEVVYVLSGKEDVFKPCYSFQGFRYVRLTEYPFDAVNLDIFRAVVVHSDIKRTGHFRCGNAKINQLYHNIIWGQKSNYLDIPTDCPQRDERLGWLGDAQIFCRTAAINFDVELFFRKWLGDVMLEQSTNGAVYGTAPQRRGCKGIYISAGWGDAICIIPWEIYLAYGNIEILQECFPAMKKWVDYIRSQGPEEYLWLGGAHFGDWLAMDGGNGSLLGSTSCNMIATAFFAHSTDILIRAGKVLGKNMEEYSDLHENIVSRFRAYFMEGGMPKEVLSDVEYLRNYNSPISDTRCGLTQTGLVLILHFGLCTDEERPALAHKLASMIYENDCRITTGFLGTPYILHALSENGYIDLAYQLLLQEKSPSWLYSVCHGATTMWEHWDSILEDGSFWSAEMNSFNHYAYGAVYDWIFGVAAGIKPVAAAPGYKKVLIQPHPDIRLGFVEVTYASRIGEIRVYWYYEGERVHYEISIPEGVTAELYLPSGLVETLSSGQHYFAE